jgi:thymidylate synthase
LGNTHIYDDHINELQIQVQREPYIFPKLNILNKKQNIEDYNIQDFSILEYKYHENIKMKMRE